MAIPDDVTLQNEILAALNAADDGRMVASEVYDLLAQSHTEVTYEERTDKYRNSKSKLANRIQFARLHLVRDGLVFRANDGPNPERAVWIVTDSGRKH